MFRPWILLLLCLPACTLPVRGSEWDGPGLLATPGDAPIDLDGEVSPEGVPEYLDFDGYLRSHGPSPGLPQGVWVWEWLPSELLYPAYLAGTKESRLGSKIFYEPQDGWLWDSTLGGRFGLLRHGTRDPLFPEGFQIDVEAAAQLRQDPAEELDVRSIDFRAGVPFTYRTGRHRAKVAYYHMSSHLGDEFLLKNPGFTRLNWSRDALVLGYGFQWRDNLLVYGEASWAFHSKVNEPWEFQFGLDYAPAYPTGFHGAPFFAVNGHLREEVDFGGAFTLQTGWSWRSARQQRLLRMGLHYYVGESNQFSFFDDYEEQVGFGIWYDY